MTTTPHRRRPAIALWLFTLAVTLLFPACLMVGTVDIPIGDVFNALSGQPVEKSTWEIIILEARLPMTCTAALAGAALSVAGLLLQTTFDNPLAGPSILGVSTGSSLGVAIVMLALGGSIGSSVSGAAMGQIFSSIDTAPEKRREQ